MSHPPSAVPSSLPTSPTSDKKVDPSTIFPPGEFSPDEVPQPHGAIPVVNLSVDLGGSVCQGSNPPLLPAPPITNPAPAAWPSKEAGL